MLPEACLALFNDTEMDVLLSGSAAVDLEDWKQHTVSTRIRVRVRVSVRARVRDEISC